MARKISTDAVINSVRLAEAAAPDTPASGYFQVYAKTDGKLYCKNDDGTEICLSDAVINPMTTAGDIIIGGASGAPGRLALGTEGYVLKAGATAPEWAAESSVDAGDVTYTPTTAADWDSDADPGDLDDALDQLAERVDDLEGAGSGTADIGARVYNDATISTSNATNTFLTFNSESYDTDSIHDASTNTERLTCKTAGKYAITGNISFASNANGARRSFIRKNGTDFIASVIVPAVNGLGTQVVVSTIIDMAINDYVELGVYQSSGGSLNVEQNNYYGPYFMMQLLAAT